MNKNEKEIHYLLNYIKMLKIKKKENSVTITFIENTIN